MIQFSVCLLIDIMPTILYFYSPFGNKVHSNEVFLNNGCKYHTWLWLKICNDTHFKNLFISCYFSLNYTISECEYQLETYKSSYNWKIYERCIWTSNVAASAFAQMELTIKRFYDKGHLKARRMTSTTKIIMQ